MKFICTFTATCLALLGTATADTITVCESGCDYDDLLPAVQAAQAGDVIEIGPGVWKFNVDNGDGGCNFETPSGNCNIPAVTFRGSVGTDGKPTTKIYKCLLRVVEDTIFENIQFGVSFTDNFNGFYMEEASPTFTNCVFYNCNRATSDFETPASIFPIFGSSPKFDNCDFTAMGGLTDENVRATLFRISESLQNMGNPGQPSNPVFTNCNFRDCGASFSGLILCQSRGTFVDCTFEDNSSTSSIFYVRANEQLLIKGCSFIGNITDPGPPPNGGAAIYISSSANDVRIESCQFTKNFSTTRGGAVCSTGGSPELIDCVFTGNVAGASGGAIYCSATGLTLANCQFSSNFPDAITGPFATTNPSHLAGDVNNDGTVDQLDVEALQNQLGSCQNDTNGDGTVDVLDLMKVIHNWGACP